MAAATSAALHPGSAEPLSRVAVLGALGVVFGDIGTSPLYALQGGRRMRRAAAA